MTGIFTPAYSVSKKTGAMERLAEMYQISEA
jgi:hypothetical protein